MAKTYINIVKYEIRQEFEIDGVVDKPDIIGAIFGQSEGLIGGDLDLRELQKSGKIGRIEIAEKNVSGKTKGTLTIPSALDMAQTSLLAAAIESIDKVGPCEARFTTIAIGDARGEKRKEIQERAKELLKKMIKEDIPASDEMTEKIRGMARKSELIFYGPDKLPAGPDIHTQEEVIVVEGRADVLNLLKNNVQNVIGLNGSNVPNSIIGLSKRKKLTVFVDGDRGGELISRHLQQVADVAFLARAPDGKEVEELTRKEIEMSLRKKIPAREIRGRGSPPLRQRAYTASTSRPRTGLRPERGERAPTRGRTPFRRTPSFDRRPREPARDFSPQRPLEPVEARAKTIELKDVPSNEKDLFEALIKALKGSLKAKILDKDNKELKEVKVRDLLMELGKTKGAKTIVFDGIITKRVVEEAKEKGIGTLVGVKIGKITEDKDIRLIEVRP